VADIVRKTDYYYTEVPNKPGGGAKVLAAIKKAGVNLLAFSGFPGNGSAQLDFCVGDPEALKACCQREGIKLLGPKTCFLIQGDDRTGAVSDILSKLADAEVNVTAFDAVSSGSGRYGGILWVVPGDVEKTARLLGATARAEQKVGAR